MVRTKYNFNTALKLSRNVCEVIKIGITKNINGFI